MIRSDRKLTFLYATTDFITLSTVFSLSHLYFNGLSYFDNHALYLVTILLTWFFIASRNKIYYVNLHSSLRYRIRKDLKSHAEFMGALAIFYLAFNMPSYYTRQQFLTPLLTFPVVGLLANFMIYKIVVTLRRNGKNVRKTLIVGSGATGRYIENYFAQNPDLGYKTIGFLDDETQEVIHPNTLGKIKDFDEIKKNNGIDEIIVTTPTHQDEKIQYIVERADYYGIRIRLVPDYYDLLGRNYKTTFFGEIPIINIREVSLDKLRYAALKRICDVIFSLTVLILLSPVFLILAILIKLESPGPVFYCPTRLGKGGKPFRLYKFRSMYENDTTGTKSTQLGDSRITKIGRIIRKYNLDELPQFLNVLFGEMSVVGPRPHRIYLNEVMQKEVDMYMVRHYLKPGITGWAQVNGWRGPTETKEQRDNRTAYDLWYVENWTPLLDLKIIFLTVFGEKTYKAAF